ncbi:ATP-binding protein [Telluribacter sp. SYSU D00476]|uniref:ATP-binding protein n=1 Tax=Telluribacter sp. SYSU D00476 TaxID=2811430 RepID=UPI001FF3C56A|nr:ATP-binding protein [Telluribacter sp. SYSU D00476]
MFEALLRDIIPPNDAERLEALYKYQILYTPVEEAFDNITHMMAQVYRAPMAFISLVDKDYVYYKSQVGPFGRDRVDRKDSLCSLTILGTEPLIIEDASGEVCFEDNPYVAAEGGIRFYAGAPLITKSGYQIGTACIVDTRPRAFSELDKHLLVRFAHMVMHEIEQRLTSLNHIIIQKELEFVTNNIPQLIWARDVEGEPTYFNKILSDYTGVSHEQLRSNWMHAIHPEDYEKVQKAWQMARETGSAYEVEYRLKRYDGTFRWFLARGVPMKDSNGDILKWYGASTDIQEQKRTEEVLEQQIQEAEQRVHSTNHLVRSIVDHSPTGIVVYTAIRDESGSIIDFQVLHYNVRSNELTGYTDEERREYSFRKILEGVNSLDQFQRYVDVVETGVAVEREQYIERTARWLTLSIVKLDDGFLGMLTDITELKNSQQSLQEQSAFANSILDASFNAVFALDAILDDSGEMVDLRIMKINKAFSTTIGLDESIIGKSYLLYFPNSRHNGIFDLYKQVYTTGQSDRKEFYSVNQNLNSWFDISAVKRDEKGIVVTFANISPQRKAAIQIEKQKNLLDNILKHSPSGITVTEMIRNEKGEIIDGRTIVANATSEVHTGIPLELSLKNTISENVPGILESPLFQQALRTLETGEPFITQYYLETTGRWLELSVAKMDEDRLINVFTDVTPIKETQLQLEKLVEDLKRSNDELEQFAYVASHDLQEPLRKIRVFNNMAAGKLDQESDIHPYLDKVDESAKRMSGLISSLLDYSRLSRNRSRFEKVDLNAVVQNVLTDYELLVNQKNAIIRLDELPTIEAIALQMNQLFYNLIGNALKFTNEDVQPEITIRAQHLDADRREQFPKLPPHHDYVEILVQDNGIGFDQEYANKIFTIFQRLNDRSSYGGYGIGLALCKKVVDTHNGVLHAEGKPGSGARFTILLPYQQA